ncbi:MAG: penicillin-binding protein 2 [Pelagibacteraceae bacterium]|nr:MAG: penicillin-binding protein 2 [Pelagibacteraceae bacterium]
MIRKDDSFEKLHKLNRRMFIIIAAKIVVFSVIVSRLFSMQIKNNEKYTTLSDSNRIREWRHPPVRGEFHDYFGKIIASNQNVYQLHLVNDEVQDFSSLVIKLKNLLDLSEVEFKKIVNKQKVIKPWEQLIILESLSWDQFSKINSFLYELPGIKPVLAIVRYYPYKENLTHVLGYVNNPSEIDVELNQEIKKKLVPGLKVGKTGLEKTFENKLLGISAIQRYEVNAYGKITNQLTYKKGSQGQKIKLTLDLEIQNLCTTLLADKAGSITVIDIFSGEIVAMQSSPSYDPNLFLYGINSDDWQLLKNNPLKPLINKTISGLYAPGSTIKPIVALSALENKIIDTNFTVTCDGKTEMYNRTYHCWKKEGHGKVDLKSAMAQSCDAYFYQVAKLLGVDKLSDTAKKFGLGEKVFDNLFENEKKGLIPNTSWKENTLGENWYAGETIIAGIGQGYTLTTPLQLCVMTAQIANGGFKVKPKIVVDDKNNSEFNLIPIFFDNQKNIQIIQEAMFSSTNEIGGTSYSSRIEDIRYQFAGKTGTSQIKKITKEQRELDLNISQIPYEERDHALYIAFGPYIKPQYAMSILIEHGGSGSAVAAPIAKELFKAVIDRDVLRQLSKKEIKL